MTGNVLAQREVAPPSNTPLEAKPAVAQPVQTNPEAYRQKSPRLLQSRCSQAQTQPEKDAKRLPSRHRSKARWRRSPKRINQAQANKTKRPKQTTKVCKTNAETRTLAKLPKPRKTTTKVAKKTTHKNVIRATTLSHPSDAREPYQQDFAGFFGSSGITT